MRRVLIVSTVVIAAVALVTTAIAANVHFKGKSGPAFTDNGLTLTSSGTLAGLGNGDVFISISAGAQPTAVCTNPSGQTQPPGQQPAPTNVSGGASFPASEIKNGNLNFSVTTQPPESPIPGAPGCPNSKWTQSITDMTFTGFSATLTVVQGGVTVLQQEFSL